MSTMFSGGGNSSASAVGNDAAAAAKPSSATPANPAATPAPAGQPGATAGGEEPFFREKVKIDGKEVDVEFKTRDELVAEIRKSRAADRRFEAAANEKKEADRARAEAAKAKKEADEIRAKYGDDALSASLDAAINSGDPEKVKRARAFMEERLANLIRQDMMDPNERAVLEERKRREAAENRLKTYEQQQEQQRLEQETGKFREEFTQTIIGALETGQVPNSDWSASIMAKLMSINLKKGYKLTPEQLAGKTKTVIMNQVTGLLASSSGEQLIEMFPELVKKVRAADLKRLRSSKGNLLPSKKVLETKTQTTTPGDSPQATPGNPNGYRTMDEERELRRKRLGITS